MGTGISAMHASSVFASALFGMAASIAIAGDAPVPQEFGNFLSHRYRAPSKEKIDWSTTDPAGGLRSHFIQLGNKANAGFDTGTLAYCAWWNGGFLDLSRTHHMTSKGQNDPTPIGTVRFTRIDGAGVGTGQELYKDERVSKGLPLPRAQARYRGLYLHGERTVLSYEIAGVGVLEMPAYDAAADAFVRTIRVPTPGAAVCIELFQAAGSGAVSGDTVTAGDRRARLIGSGASLAWKDGKALLLIPQGTAPVQVTVALGQGASKEGSVQAFATDLSTLTTGGPGGRWKPLTSSGVVAADDAAYVMDTFTFPANPWGTGWRLGAIDFMPDGRIAVATITGDVWIVAFDKDLKNLTWTRFATGLYEPLGLVVVDGKVMVRGRDQITRLHDLNNDGQADFYENFHNDDTCSTGYHAFAFELQRDSKGNFWYNRAAHKAWTKGPHNGGVMRVSPDGLTTTVIANAAKAANGMGIGPEDRIYLADNQDASEQVPDNPVYFVRENTNYGSKPGPEYGAPDMGAQDVPMLSLPKEVDRSCGGQIWMNTKAFGPLSGLMFHTSYGNSNIIPMLEQALPNGTRQAAGYVLPVKPESGVMRGRCGPDGQLYVVGQVGWDSNGAKSGCLHRVRYTGKPYALPVRWSADKTSMTIGFAGALDPASVTVDNFSAMGNRRSSDVEGSAKAPSEKFVFTKAELGADGTTVTLAFNQPKLSITCRLIGKLKTKDGVDLPLTLYFTIR